MALQDPVIITVSPSILNPSGSPCKISKRVGWVYGNNGIHLSTPFESIAREDSAQ